MKKVTRAQMIEFVKKTARDAEKVKVKCEIGGMGYYKDGVDCHIFLRQVVSSNEPGHAIIYQGNVLTVNDEGCEITFALAPTQGIFNTITMQFKMIWDDENEDYNLYLNPLPVAFGEGAQEYLEHVICMFYALNEGRHKFGKLLDWSAADEFGITPISPINPGVLGTVYD